MCSACPPSVGFIQRKYYYYSAYVLGEGGALLWKGITLVPLGRIASIYTFYSSHQSARFNKHIIGAV